MDNWILKDNGENIINCKRIAKITLEKELISLRDCIRFKSDIPNFEYIMIEKAIVKIKEAISFLK